MQIDILLTLVKITSPTLSINLNQKLCHYLLLF